MSKDLAKMDETELRDELAVLRAEALKAKAASTSTPSSPAPVTKIVVQRDRKLSHFSGKTADGFSDWHEEASSAVDGLADGEAANFVYGRLGPDAKLEIKTRGDTVRKSATKMLAALAEVYADARTSTQILRQFYDRQQAEGEDPTQYSHALVALLENCDDKLDLDDDDRDHMLRDQFMENLRDSLLIWELQKVVEADADTTFLAVRKIAMKWWRRTQAAKPKSRKQTKPVAEFDVDVDAATAAEPAPEWKLAFDKQQKDINALMEQNRKLIEELDMKRDEAAKEDEKQRQRRPRGNCWDCGRPGHLQRDCRSGRRRQPENGPPRNAQAGNDQPLPNPDGAPQSR